MDHVPQVGVTSDAGVGEHLVQVQLDGLRDHVGVDGEEDDEGRAGVGEESVDGVENAQDLPLLTTVQAVHHHDVHLLHQVDLLLDCLEEALRVDHVVLSHGWLEVSPLGEEEGVDGLTNRVEVGHHHHPQYDGQGDH